MLHLSDPPGEKLAGRCLVCGEGRILPDVFHGPGMQRRKIERKSSASERWLSVEAGGRLEGMEQDRVWVFGGLGAAGVQGPLSGAFPQLLLEGQPIGQGEVAGIGC